MLTRSQQQAYIPQPAMVPQPVVPFAHQVYYQPVQPAKPEPAKPEPPKPEAPKITGDPKQEFYCRELDGSWSLRTMSAIVKECHPGFWQTSKSGYPVWYRQKA